VELCRHRLVRLSDAGWRCASMQHTADDAQRCLGHWIENDLPVVVATQLGAASDKVVSLGLPAPTAWGRKRYAVRVAASELRPALAAFPAPSDCRGILLHAPDRWSLLCDALERLAPGTRVYGSYGWQAVTGLAYVCTGSDVDLLLPAADARHGDAIVALLEQSHGGRPRLDGELCFADGSAVAWREWGSWRAGKARSVLVKRLRGGHLEGDRAWPRPRATAGLQP
jgi:phosphoribosyl-dephospho-CoA transferase